MIKVVQNCAGEIYTQDIVVMDGITQIKHSCNATVKELHVRPQRRHG